MLLSASERVLLHMDIDAWLDQEHCPCEGTCTCEEDEAR